jgi:predicted O-linked N-acetylglucosamine transferase (SPINDLY family)
MNRQFPQDIKALKIQFNAGSTLHQQGKLSQAREIYQNILAQHPQHFDALYLLGAIELQTDRPTEALEWIDKAIALNPRHPGVHCNRGIALHDLKQHQAAIESYNRAIALYPQYAEAYSNRGNVFRELRQYPAAIESYSRAIAIKPQYGDAYSNRGNALRESGQYAAAVKSYDVLLKIQPDYPFLRGLRLHTKTYIVDWSHAEIELKQLIQRIARDEKVTPCFPFLALHDSLALQYQVAKMWTHTEHPPNPALGRIAPRKPSKKIRIGYFSADFHAHATAFLMAELWEQHDKKRFEIIAFSFGTDSDDAMRQRLLRTFDQFIEVRQHTDQEVAQLSRSMGIDIAIDLKGFTTDNRLDIFAYRAAPIQVSYIGYPGTLGADYIDYIIADKTLIPESAQKFYTEKIIYLPHSYQVNDRQRKIADKVFTREELGLPAKDAGFVFCCFNNNYKITPTTFDGWMRILQHVPKSVLWLLGDNPQAIENLRKEAQQRGIDTNRLVFAPRMPLTEHLARHRAADLFIDTLPCNAHTTTSDALWAGLPVLTCMGESFAARVAASLLNAIELPELITTTQVDYEKLAIELALNPDKLQRIREKLNNNRLTTPLFDSELFTHHIENAYEKIMQRYNAQLPPEHIVVPHDVKNKNLNKNLNNFLYPALDKIRKLFLFSL